MLESWFNKGGDKTEMHERTAEEQAVVDLATSKLALYHYDSCFFCGRVRSTIADLGLQIELRNIHQERGHHERLIAEGGSGTVPCLAISDDAGSETWLYESADIIRYLREQFGAAA